MAYFFFNNFPFCSLDWITSIAMLCLVLCGYITNHYTFIDLQWQWWLSSHSFYEFRILNCLKFWSCGFSRGLSGRQILAGDAGIGKLGWSLVAGKLVLLPVTSPWVWHASRVSSCHNVHQINTPGDQSSICNAFMPLGTTYLHFHHILLWNRHILYVNPNLVW